MMVVGRSGDGGPPASPPSGGQHAGELRLRRFRAGELAGDERDVVARHTASCAGCRGRLRALEEEQRGFEREVPFDRFAGGVERARRVPRVHPRRAWTLAALGFASAAAAVLVVWGPSAESARRGLNRIKGTGALAEVRIASADGQAQRTAVAGSTEVVRAGERLRIGVRAGERRHVAVVSVDDQGEVTPLYPRPGKPLAVDPRRELTYLPDSLQLTGGGHERMYLLLSDRPLEPARVEAAVRAAHARAQGDLRAAGRVAVEATGSLDQFTWLFEKKD